MTAFIYITSVFNAILLLNAVVNLSYVSDLEEQTGEDFNKLSFQLAIVPLLFFVLYGLLLILGQAMSGTAAFVYLVLMFMWGTLQLAAGQKVLNLFRRNELPRNLMYMGQPVRIQISLFATTGVVLWAGYLLLTTVFRLL